MPPRSVCLNVFTASLGNGNEAGMSVREVGGERMELDGKQEDGADERGRHDSAHASPNECIATPPSYTESITTADASTIATTDSNTSSQVDDMGCCVSAIQDKFRACDNCAQTPPEGASLQRCSRCKRKYYCSKACQKQDWKQHRNDCEATGHGSPSALTTPDISTPGTPTSANGPSQSNNQPVALTEQHPLGAPPPLPQPGRWPHAITPGEETISITFGARSIDSLRRNLADAFCLYINEHGGPAASFETALLEFQAFFDCARARCDQLQDWNGTIRENTISDAIYRRKFDIWKTVSRHQLLSEYGINVVKEFDMLNNAVYNDMGS